MHELTLDQLHILERLLDVKRRVLVAIDGNSGAGKSTLGCALADRYGANLLHMDDFFLPPEKRTKQRLAEPGGNVDYERFKREALDPLILSMPFSYRPFDCREGELGEPVRVEPKQLSIVEGVYSLHPTLARAYDLKVFCRIDPEQQRARILKRSGEEKLHRFLTEWIPLENAYFDAFGIRESCELVL